MDAASGQRCEKVVMKCNLRQRAIRVVSGVTSCSMLVVRASLKERSDSEPLVLTRSFHFVVGLGVRPSIRWLRRNCRVVIVS